MTPAPAPAADGEAAAPVSAWYMVAVLGVVLLLSFIDRYALTVLVDPIRADLRLSDGQVGLLLGLAFAVFYSSVSLPLGHLVDRWNRRRLLFGGILLWTSMTVLSGFATNFETLFIGRMGVGLGEAVVSPAAYSLIRDAFPRHQQPRAFALYLLGSSVGTGAALIVVGLLSDVLPGAALVTALLPQAALWQKVLVVVGLAGFPVAALVLTIREPTRRGAAAHAAPSFGAVIGHARARRALFGPLLLAHAAWGVAIYSYASWLPTALARGWQVAPTAVGSTYGTIIMMLAPLAAATFPLVFERIARVADTRGLALAFAAICATVAVPTAIGPLAGDATLTWLCVGANIFFAMGNQLMLAVLLARLTPGAMIGRMSALAFIGLNMLGLGLGPSLVAWLSGQLSGATDASAMGVSLAIVAPLAWLCVAGSALMIERAMRNDARTTASRARPAGR